MVLGTNQIEKQQGAMSYFGYRKSECNMERHMVVFQFPSLYNPANNIEAIFWHKQQWEIEENNVVTSTQKATIARENLWTV